ncbi:MAG: hypothetical protein WBB23_10040 [Desulforhopalus sp.]
MTVFFAGLVLVFCGIIIIVNPTFYSTTYSMTFDFSNIKFPLGSVFIIIGIYYLYKAVKLQKPEFQYKQWICPQCQETSLLMGENNHKCKQCDVVLEKLDGFYERHPNM